jgi:signal transduction histidine kinase
MCCFSFFCFAQKLKPINAYNYTKFNNFSLENVNAITKDKYNFLWISTQDGLIRFDGKNYTEYNTAVANLKHQLPYNFINCVISDTINNRIIAISTGAVISIINPITNTVEKNISIPILKGKNLFVPYIYYLEGNNIYLADPSGYVLRYNLTNFSTTFIIDKAWGNNAVSSRMFISKNHLTIFNNMGQWKMIDTKTNVEISNGLISIFANEQKLRKNLVVEFSNNNFISIFNNNFYQLQVINNTLSYRKINLKKFTAINAICKTKNGIVFQADDKLYLIDSLFNLQEGFFSVSDNLNKYVEKIQTFMQDDNFLWAGCDNGFLKIELNNEAFLSFGKSINNKSIDACFSLSKLTDSTVLTANVQGLKLFNHKSLTIRQIGKVNYSQTIIKLNKNTHLVSSEVGNCLYNSDGKIVSSDKYKQLLEVISNGLVATYNISKDSILYLNSSFSSTIYLFNLKTCFLDSIELVNPQTNIATKGAKNISFSTNGKSVFFICPNQIFIYDIILRKLLCKSILNPKTKKPLYILTDLVDCNNVKWLSVFGVGLYSLNNDFEAKELYSIKEGFKNLAFYKISKLGDTALLLTTNNGLYLFNCKTRRIRGYFQEDGLFGNAFNDGAALQVDSNLILGGQNGFTIVNPQELLKKVSYPMLFFQEIHIVTDKQIYDTFNLELQKITIPKDYKQVTINFITLNYSNTTNINYWYKINELGNQWIELKNQNFVDLIGLQHGSYTLQIKVANEEGIECSPKELKIKILPYWYQTLLFKILVVLVILALLYALYSFRIRQLKRIITVRQKISSNLHDDIGSTLSSINMYSQIAQLQPNDGNYINTIQENTQEVLAKLDDIVWATNPKNDKIKSVIERMDNFARPLLQAKNIQFLFNHNDEIEAHKISEATRQNLFLIFKEAINNIAKYAECKNCRVELSIHNKTIYCTITDDGIGFDATKSTQRNGLVNMKQRANELKGEIEISSKINEGTIIKLQLPL